MEPFKYRLLLPAQRPRSSPGNSGPSRELAKKRTATSAPCKPCREHKIKCDGFRPVCRPCSHRSRDCAWVQPPGEKVEALKRKYTELKEEMESISTAYETLVSLFEIIKSRDEADAAAVYQRLRQGAEPEAVLDLVREAELLLQLQHEVLICPPLLKGDAVRLARPDANGKPPRPLPSAHAVGQSEA
ncbi:hypothetical protein B0T14DRAFT_126330 [Immersiella caudata]|uniref:Zn(2)-C6 fungal-type domain-containing protein n=1 Tax=Immersiella caudata TaxID=314043 RepID=A0AA39X4B2_9PEZI|nr:hypothetical protein B0T14DRAFT_126330 [Immersiella caudata]